MSDRFDITLERKLDTKPDGADDGPRGVRRIELITGTGRRRHWSTAERSRILLESLEPGANVSEVAHRNGLSPPQLFGWRWEARALIVDDVGTVTSTTSHGAHVVGAKGTKAKASGRARPSAGATPRFGCAPCADVVPKARVPHDTPAQFAPIMITAAAAAPPPSPDRTPCGVIDIVVGDCVVRVRGLVDAGALATVLKAVRRSS